MRRLFRLVCRGVNEFGKLFDRATQRQFKLVALRAVKVQENGSVSFYGTIRYIMRL